MASKLRTPTIENGAEEKYFLKPVKAEGAPKERSSFVDPILAAQSEIIFDRVTPPNSLSVSGIVWP